MVGLAEPDGVEPCPSSTSTAPELASFPTDRKVELAIELERATLAGDPRITGVRTSSYGDASARSRDRDEHGHRGVVACDVVLADSPRARCAGRRGRRSGYGIDVGRDAGRPRHRRDGRGRRRASHPHARSATKPKSRRLTVVLDPRVAASFLSIVGGTLTGERGPQGTVAVRRPDGRRDRRAGAHARRRPDEP